MTRILPTASRCGLPAAFCSLVAVAALDLSHAENGPKVTIRTAGDSLRPSVTATRTLYPWKTFITCTVFWVGEQPTQNNPVPNCRSSWDMDWMQNFGGYDDPDPKRRIADHARGEFRPKAFVPKLNPFYVALPYNDIAGGGMTYKPEAERVIPWFDRVVTEEGLKSVLKGRWVQIFWNGRSCYAQWEDCGPWVTDDWAYVFGDKKPRNRRNKSAGIDISPAIRDYLQVKSGERVHWRFVEAGQVPHGPWKKYGLEEQRKQQEAEELEAQRKYLEYLRELRDKQFMERPVRRFSN
ncbi:MAG: hypothetical protein R3242_01720 [Akkermansiaceae bacterium]|nr:hypothetical protein [Akkermansiaceae bacterium]